jgi:hypothetical protein
MSVAAFGLVVLAGSLRADEEKVPLDQLPRAVVQGVKTRYPAATLVSAEKETEAGKIVFEVAIENERQKIELTLTPEGEINEIEKHIEAKDMPAAVTRTLEEKYPRATYKTIEEVVKVEQGKEKLAYFEVLLETQAKKKLEVCVTPSGKVSKEEDKSRGKE